MTQWYVKELSKLTQVSVQTLHHYDRIALLKPSIRLANGYRVYSEKDLLKLQQIIALKFFGFELAKIKTLLSEKVSMIDHFSAQSKLLDEKAKILFEASETLKNVISGYSHDKSIPWGTIIKLIEVYRMTQQLENAWAAKILNHDELKQFIHLEQELKTKFTPNGKKAYEEGWHNLVNEVNANLKKDPSSDTGIMLGERCMRWANSIYGKKYVGLRSAIWVKGFKSGLVAELGLSQEAVIWLDTAMHAYSKNRITNILKQIDTHPHQAVLEKWEEMLVDFYGDEKSLRDEFLQNLMEDKNIKQAAKEWLKKVAK